MILLKLNESSASLRVVPLPPLVRVSDSTSAATNESGRTFYFSMGGVNYGSGGSLSLISADMGLYHCCFSASKISITGPGMVYYGLPNSSLTALQVSAPFMVVPIDSYDSMRLGLFALPNAAAEAAGGLITHGTGTGQLHTSAGSVGLKAGTHSEVTIQGVTRLNSNVTLNANTHSGATVQGISNYANLPFTSIATSIWSTLRSNFTTPGSFGEYVYSQVTGISSGTVFGITDTSNFPSGSGATAGEVARAVWANSGRTLEGVSTATIFADSRSIWSALRSAYTTPGSFGEYVYSQVTGTSTGTVQGVTRALNLSANGDKTGYSISGTKTTLDALNDIDGSGVTLHVGLHSGASVEVKASGIVAGSIAAASFTAAKFAAGAIDAVALATDAGQEIADRLIARNIAGGSDTGRNVGDVFALMRNKSSIDGSTLTVFDTDDSTSRWTASITTGTSPIAGVDPT